MAEQRIIITIDENGKIDATTEGLKGEVCLTELQEILESDLETMSVKKTDEYYQQNELRVNNTIKNKNV